MNEQTVNATGITGTESATNDMQLVSAESVRLIKRVVRNMALSPSASGIEMARGAIAVLDALDLWQDGEIEQEEVTDSDMNMIAWLTQFLLRFAKRRGLGRTSIVINPKENFTSVNIGQYSYYKDDVVERWRYEPKDENGMPITIDYEWNINPNRIKKFSEPPTENRSTAADQSTAEQ